MKVKGAVELCSATLLLGEMMSYARLPSAGKAHAMMSASCDGSVRLDASRGLR
jgi:hypothetical protein